MIVSCEKCNASYKIDETRLDGKPGKLRCKNCGNVQVIYPAGQGPAGQAGADPHGKMTIQAQAVTGPDAGTKTSHAAAHAATTATTSAATPPVWYIAYQNERKGPWTEVQIISWIDETKPSGPTHVWKQGFDAWKSLEQVEPFATTIQRLAQQRQQHLAASAQARAAAQQASDAGPSASAAASDGKVEDRQQRIRANVTLSSLIKVEEDDASSSSHSRNKIDLSDLVSQDAIIPQPTPGAAPSTATTKKPAVATQYLAEYRPPEKKKIPWLAILFAPSVLVVIASLVLTLAYFRVINVPVLEHLPLIGHLYHEEQVSYQDLRENYLSMVKANEERILFQQEQERKIQESERLRMVEEEKRIREERRQRILARMEALNAATRSGGGRASVGGGGGGGGGQQVMEFSFDDSADDLETTGGAMGSGGGASLPPLTQAQITGTVRANMNDVAGCLQQSREVYKENISGEITMGWTISFRGSVRNVRMTNAGYRNSFLADCLIEKISRWRFPKSGGSVQIQYPFTIR